MISSDSESRQELRKQNHSVIEKRRREKINQCLKELQNLVPSCRNQTLQKLTILERTVEYLYMLQKADSDSHQSEDGLSQSEQDMRSLMKIDNLLC